MCVQSQICGGLCRPKQLLLGPGLTLDIIAMDLGGRKGIILLAVGRVYRYELPLKMGG